MFFASLVLTGLVGASAIDLQHRNNDAGQSKVLCGSIKTAEPAIQPNIPSPELQSSETTGNTSAIIPIDIVLQILSANNTSQGGDIANELIDEQMLYLNDAFRPVGFSFRLSDVVRTVNEEWYKNLRRGTDFEDQVVTLRKGGKETLNVYTYGTDYDPGWSWATLPSERGLPMVDITHDGVFLHRRAWRGGDYAEFELGGVLVHEVGHWFGLYHTVSFDCIQSFDYVSDTPIELAPETVGGCDIGRDSCPDQPGVDLIHNWMGFSRDTCRGDFTAGQIQRMKEQMAKYRGVVYPGIDVEKIPEDGI